MKYVTGNKVIKDFQNISLDEMNKIYSNTENKVKVKSGKDFCLLLILLAFFTMNLFTGGDENKNPVHIDSPLPAAIMKSEVVNYDKVFLALPTVSPLVSIDPRSVSMYQNKVKLEQIKNALVGINANQEKLLHYKDVDLRNNQNFMKNAILEAERNDISKQEILEIKKYISDVEREILKEHSFVNDQNYSTSLENEMLNLTHQIYILIEKPETLNNYRFNRDKPQKDLDVLLSNGGMSFDAKNILNEYNLNRLK